MGNWFDALAKRSAENVPVASGTGGLTRRQVIVRGAAVTGAAWTAPMLLAVRPAFAGVSQCPDPKTEFSTCDDGTFRCCPEGEICGLFPDGTYGCDIPLGGVCGNRGQGVQTCNFGQSRCNQPASDQEAEPICGGPGAKCDMGEVCLYEGTCAGPEDQERCGGEGAPCTGDEQCAAKTINQPATTCVNGVCTA